MIHRITRVPVVGLLAVVALLSACGEGSKYAGDWKRELYGEGDVQMKLASNGGVELMLPSPRWPDSVDIKGRGRLHRRHSGLQGGHARSAPVRPRTPATSSTAPRTSCTSPGWAWTPAAAGARRWWGPGLRVRERGEGQSFTGFRRPLLGDAVEGAQSPDQIGAVDPDDVPAREEPLRAWPAPPRPGRDRTWGAAPGRWRCRSWRSSPEGAAPRDGGRAASAASRSGAAGRPGPSCLASRSRFSCSGS